MTDMLLPVLAMIAGMVLLMWSSDKFIEGAASVATALGMSQLIVGMVIVGFGTSVPEMLVSALSSWQGNPGIALGNAYGSNVANITLILGATALIRPVPVPKAAVAREIPILLAVTLFAAAQVGWDYSLGRLDAIALLALFAALMYLTFRSDAKNKTPAVESGAETHGSDAPEMPRRAAVFWCFAGLVLLMASSQMLVWGAVATAKAFGVSDLTIGLTVVAVGTSLPEFASSLAAARRNRHGIVVGNIIGSNLFNTLAVVGIAGVISPITAERVVFSRDLLSVAIATAALFLVCIPRKGRPSVIVRGEGAVLLAMYVAYVAWVVAPALR